MHKSEHYLEWMLLAVRMLVGLVLIGHGGQKIFAILGQIDHNANLFTIASVPYFAIFFELIGGGLIATGAVIELGTLLVVPAMLLALFVSQFGANCFMGPVSLKYILNLVMLAIAVGICGPGKWALWDPGKSLRQKIFG